MVHSFTYNCLSMHFPELDLNSRAIVLSIDRISQPWFCVAHTDPVELCSQSGNIATNHIYFLVHVVRKHAFAHNKRGNGNGFQTLLSPSCWRICPLCWKPPKTTSSSKRVSDYWMSSKMPTHQQWSTQGATLVSLFQSLSAVSSHLRRSLWKHLVKKVHPSVWNQRWLHLLTTLLPEEQTDRQTSRSAGLGWGWDVA